MPSETFVPRPDQVAAARHFALGAIGQTACDPNDLGLIVSELATNACVHAHRPFTVSVERRGSQVVIDVADAGPGSIAMQPRASSGTSGRGLQIVAAIAQNWGVQNHQHGKSVWAVLECRNESARLFPRWPLRSVPAS
jgi:anti-sigma regulatory factor (Ser/Thr protein kinase)